MSEETPHERMETVAELAAERSRLADEQSTALEAVGDALADSVSDAVAEAGVSVEIAERSGDGRRQTLRARLDRAALIAAVIDELPAGFVVEHVNQDGTLTIEWDERESVPSERHYGAILKAIVAEEMETDADGLIRTVPTRERVLARAVELDVPEAAAANRLDRLVELDVFDLDDGSVYPDSNFSKV